VIGSLEAEWFIHVSHVVITQLKMDRGLALQDLITGTYEVLETVELPKQARVYLLDQLGLCEYVYPNHQRSNQALMADSFCRHRLSVGGSEKIQLTALLGAFKYAVELSQKK
jgi:replication factor C subunit 3/5